MKAKERPPYSQRFLAQYGQRLKREEIRLVQAYRMLLPDEREALLARLSNTIIEKVQAYTWECDKPSVVKGYK